MGSLFLGFRDNANPIKEEKRIICKIFPSVKALKGLVGIIDKNMSLSVKKLLDVGLMYDEALIWYPGVKSFAVMYPIAMAMIVVTIYIAMVLKVIDATLL